MGAFLLIVFFLVSVLIVGLILLQEGKGGGLVGMSTGMDGVMGAKNPLRRMTAWLFVIFVCLAVGINVLFHDEARVQLPTGSSELRGGPREMQEGGAGSAIQVRPEPTEPQAPETVRPEGAAAPAEVEAVRPEGAPEPQTATDAGTTAEEPAPAPEDAATGETPSDLRPEPVVETTETPVVRP